MTMHFAHADTEAVDQPLPVKITHRAATDRRGFYSQKFKFLLDLTLTLIALPIVMPVLLLLAALVALDGKSPLYSQMRIGQHGRAFRMWKLRTMVHDADGRLESYLEQNAGARREWDETQKLKTDPRITKIGRIMRKTSLDELPQLWNVLNGTMSLVGPRPIMTQQRELYAGCGYFNLKPGITGLWQISDRNECEFAARVYYDDLYEKTVSLKTDASVLLRTIGVVLRGTGY